MIMLKVPDELRQPPDVDWSRVRTWWVCPTFDGIHLDEDAPVSVREEAEQLIYKQFERQVLECKGRGADHVWLGEPAKDAVDWMDPKVWYPVHAMFTGYYVPEQPKRPYRLSPLTTYDG